MPNDGAAAQQASLQLWGGVECSVVRIGDTWRDQVRETGHHDRLDDLDRIAALGIRTLRYPILWERCTPGPAHAGWAWHDERLERMRALGITPIAGLVHHGSGPPGTNPLDPDWAEALAAYAAQAAKRYPWIRHWTPVNEPLTTARFAAMYGYWHPHTRTPAAFELMLFNQCRAVLLAMRAIRRHVPDAVLVQTEDLGRVFSTPCLAHQAEHDNARRWLSLDLLYGWVDRDHPAWKRFAALGIPLQWLDELRSGEAAPDLLGINRYVTSDRFLDHRTALYPAGQHCDNGRDSYVDIEAVRMDLSPDLLGWEPRLREAWRRYGRPMAVTEAHLACTDPVEPVRWLLEAWRAALALRAEGVDLRAVTAWSLFGAVDWDTMLREGNKRYEPGLWDARADPPRPTPLAEAAASLARTGAFGGLGSDGQGWWRSRDRLHAAARRA
ncbi:MAG: family 1 glycosylhydrolase [Janthinobacterium lividum]